MEASFLKLKQAILSNNVTEFDTVSSKLVENTSKDGATPLLISQADSAGYTLLHWAAHVMKPQFIQKCLEFGVSIDCKDRLGKTALHRAMDRSQTDPEQLIEAFASFLTPAVIASQDRMGRTALHVACMKGYDKTAAILIEICMKREDVNTWETSTGSADSSVPASDSGLLVQSDDSIVAVRDQTGWTALHFASFYNRMHVIRLLLSTLPNGNSDANGSPRNSPSSSKPVSKSGSPPPGKSGLRDGVGSSSGSSHPDHRVSTNSAKSEASHQQSDRSSIKLPLSALQQQQANASQNGPRRFPSVDVNAKSNDGWTALHAAAAQGHIDALTELLIVGGGDPNSTALHGQTPLHVACLNSHIACVKLLREHDADPKLLDKAGLSSFACASKEIRLILRKTAAITQTSPQHTSVVGMPHNPTAEREVKFAIQARDKWNRRRTQGGDFFDVVVSREVPVDSEECAPTSLDGTSSALPTAVSTSTIHTPTATVQITRHIQVSSRSALNSIPGDPKQFDSGSTEMEDVSARRESFSSHSVYPPSTPTHGTNTNGSTTANNNAVFSSLTSDYILTHSSSSPNGSKKNLVHNTESPRLILKSSQVSSTPLLPSKSKTEWAESRFGDGLNTIADEDEDFVIPRARSDIPISRSESQVPNASSLRVATTFTPAKITTAIKDLESGMYILRWRPMHEGAYHVSIKLRGVEIHGAPIFVNISPPGGHRSQSSSTEARRTNAPTAAASTATSNAAPTANASSTPFPTYYEYPEGGAPSTSLEEATPLRSPSIPIDLISGIRPDLTPKPVITHTPTKDSKEKDKKDKRDKKSGKSTPNATSSTLSGNTDRDRSSTIGSQSPLSVSPSSTSALSNASGVSSLAVSDQSHSRKRSSSATSSKGDPQSARARSGSELRNTNQVSSDPGRLPRSQVHSLAVPLSGPMFALAEEDSLPASASSATSSRGLYRMTSTFSPMKSASNELVRSNGGDAAAASKEIADLTSQVADLNKQLTIYATRIQDLETEQIIADRRRRDEDHQKTIASLSAALQVERDARTCQGCHSALRNAVAVPCLHLSHCNNCIETLSACPTCRGPLKGFITALVEGSAPSVPL